MSKVIPSILQYTCGPTLGIRWGGADYGVVAIVESAHGLEEYLDHPLHHGVQDNWLTAMVAERKAVQLAAPSGLSWARN